MSVFKRLFGLGKKSPEGEGPKIDYEINDLEKGFLLDYNLETWEIKDVATYYWSSGSKELEYTLALGKRKSYLNFSPSNEQLSIYTKVNMQDVWSSARQAMLDNENPTHKSFAYNGKQFRFEGAGEATVENSHETYGVSNWLFMSDDQQEMISFNKYEDQSTDAHAGKKIASYEIDNILPRS